MTRGGLSGDGRVTIVIAVVVALLFLLVDHKRVAAGLTIAGGVVAAGTALNDMGDIKHRADTLSPSASTITATIGAGLIRCAVAGAAIIVAGVLAVSEARRS